MIKILKKWIFKSSYERKFILEALFYLIYYRILIYITTFKVLAKYSQLVSSKIQNNNIIDENLVNDISKAINISNKYVPNATCLTQSFTAQKMMKKRNISGLFFLGVGKDKDKLIAHSWVSCNDTIVTGNYELEKYTIVASYTW